jgi:hypothetical protein
MNHKVFLFSTALAATLFSAQKLAAQTANCGPHDVVTARLADRYGESRQVIAMTADQSVMEVFASAETGSWTVTITKAGQQTCLVAAGENYQHVAEVLQPSSHGL